MQVPTQGSHDTSTRTRSTCTVDLLTIIFLQLLLMPAVFQYFKDSQHYIYNHVSRRHLNTGIGFTKKLTTKNSNDRKYTELCMAHDQSYS